MPCENNFYDVGTKVKAYFEGKLTKGTLHAEGEKDTLALKTTDGKIHWTHNHHMTLDRSPMPVGTPVRRRWL